MTLYIRIKCQQDSSSRPVLLTGCISLDFIFLKQLVLRVKYFEVLGKKDPALRKKTKFILSDQKCDIKAPGQKINDFHT